MSDCSTLKAQLRERGFAQRKRAHAAADGAAEAARDHLLSSRLLTGARVVSGYRPIRTEIDPTPLMVALHEAGHALCVPVIMASGEPLRFRAWTPDATMVEGPFGARIPAEGDWLEPDALICPLVAFDRTGRRLGYGGGFYDRTLAQLRARRRCTAIGFAYAGQEIEGLPADDTDQPLDAVVTEEGLIRPAAATGRG